MLSIFLQGIAVTAGLIIAIGAQNAFVLKQGLRQQHVFWVALICFLCDVVLISAGVFGMGQIFSHSPLFSRILAGLGALFLLYYGWRCAKSAYQGNSALEMNEDDQRYPLRKTVMMTLAITLLNPHVYLDTLVLMGSIAGTLGQTQKGVFLSGSLLVSFVWFFGLAYGARLLVPLFKRPLTWRILDALIALMMWVLAYYLLDFMF